MKPSRWIVLGAAALIVTAGLTAGAQAPAPSPPGQPAPPASPAPTEDAHPKLPAGAGKDLVIRVCSPCHEPEKVVDQEFDQAGWKTLVDQMGAQGANATDEEFDQIVRYLAKAFPPTR